MLLKYLNFFSFYLFFLQIFGMFVGIWSLVQMNYPNIGMCFPAECSTNEINGKTYFSSAAQIFIRESGNYAVMMEDYNSLLAPFFGTTNDHCFTAEDKTHARDPPKGLDLVILVILASITGCGGGLTGQVPGVEPGAATFVSKWSTERDGPSQEPCVHCSPLGIAVAVSYTHLTLPTNREV